MAEYITRYTITNMDQVGEVLQQIGDKIRQMEGGGAMHIDFFISLQNYLNDPRRFTAQYHQFGAFLGSVAQELTPVEKNIIKKMQYREEQLEVRTIPGVFRGTLDEFLSYYGEQRGQEMWQRSGTAQQFSSGGGKRKSRKKKRSKSRKKKRSRSKRRTRKSKSKSKRR